MLSRSVAFARTARVASRAFSTRPPVATLPELPYGYADLEPIVSEEIMTIHHSKHHQAYVTNLNLTNEKISEAEAANDSAAVKACASALNFNGGGHINHSIFWTNLCPKKDFSPCDGELLNDITKTFGGIEEFQTKFAATAAAVQGSGWGWLGYDKGSKELKIATTANQDALEKHTGLVPLLGIDVWEHAYYLQYKNVRPSYLKAIWEVVNWKNVAERYAAAKI